MLILLGGNEVIHDHKILQNKAARTIFDPLPRSSATNAVKIIIVENLAAMFVFIYTC
jgi:hypothetical protein